MKKISMFYFFKTIIFKMFFNEKNFNVWNWTSRSTKFDKILMFQTEHQKKICPVQIPWKIFQKSETSKMVQMKFKICPVQIPWKIFQKSETLKMVQMKIEIRKIKFWLEGRRRLLKGLAIKRRKVIVFWIKQLQILQKISLPLQNLNLKLNHQTGTWTGTWRGGWTWRGWGTGGFWTILTQRPLELGVFEIAWRILPWTWRSWGTEGEPTRPTR